MPCVQQGMNRENRRTSRNGNGRADPHCQKGHALLEQTTEDQIPQAEIEVGNSRFLIRSGDRILLEDLSSFCESLKGMPRAEVRFTNKLLLCTEEGRLPPWGWQNQPNRIG